jgi:beta-N-acetylhexosaminidase
VQIVKLGPTTSDDQLAAVARDAERANRVLVATFVRRVEGEGRFAIPQRIGDWIDSLAKRRDVSVIAFGNPYLLRQFPDVQTYIVAYGVSDDLERAAVEVLRGGKATGRAPVTLPGFFSAGTGLQR